MSETTVSATTYTPTLEAPRNFDYSKIPDGFYQDVIESGHPVRRAWHVQKFERVTACLRPGKSLLDIGCFAGTFLGSVPPTLFGSQLGVDILPNQITYANGRFGSDFRRFRCISALSELVTLRQKFSCITLIEVIEHLRADEIETLFDGIHALLEPGGQLVFSTPNYLSGWPILEWLLNRFSDVSYEEQHITKFTYRNVVGKVRRITRDFDKRFSVDFKTTTHFLSPFLAPLSWSLSQNLSRAFTHRSWRHPFGLLVMVSLTKKGVHPAPADG